MGHDLAHQLPLEDALADPETEAGVLDAVYDLMRDRATFVIAHGLVRMEEVDEILALDRGRIIQRGTHEELVNAFGQYQALFEVQREALKVQWGFVDL